MKPLSHEERVQFAQFIARDRCEKAAAEEGQSYVPGQRGQRRTIQLNPKDAGGTPDTGLVADYSTLVDRRLDLLDRRTSLLEDAWRSAQSPSWSDIFKAIRKKIIS
jgi:hypothetical protein